MRTVLRASALSASAAVAIALCSAPASAQLQNAGTFKNLTNAQTGPTTVTPTSPFFNAGGSFTSAGDYMGATLTSPTRGTENLPITGTNFGIGPSFLNQAAMDAAYPFGTYTISLTGGTFGPTSVILNYTADAYALNVPQLTAASFMALQGLSAGAGPLAVNFNAQMANSMATSSFTFFTIFGTSDFCGFLAPSATSCTIDPHALTPETSYTWELDFSNRIESFQNGVVSYTDFDVRTDGMFTTGIPEPSTWAMLIVGFAGLGYAARRGARVGAAA